MLLPSVWLLVAAEPVIRCRFARRRGARRRRGGLGYRGSLEVINRIAPADRRSEVVSSSLIALFAGNSVPVIGIGVCRR